MLLWSSSIINSCNPNKLADMIRSASVPTISQQSISFSSYFPSFILPPTPIGLALFSESTEFVNKFIMGSKPRSGAKNCSCGIHKLGLVAIVLALFTALYSYLNARLDQFYIFEPEYLHDLSQRAISTHGNDTKAVVSFIVDELDQRETGAYVNKDQEWVFNNAGGAMGAMYVIHASITEYLIIFGECDPLGSLFFFPFNSFSLRDASR